jgi:ribosome-binding protein aMBF1 (putative translation factor)
LWLLAHSYGDDHRRPQIRKARELLGWSPSKLAQRAKVHSAILRRAESTDGEPLITVHQAALIRHALQDAGVEFASDACGVRLKRSENAR